MNPGDFGLVDGVLQRVLESSRKSPLGNSPKANPPASC